ncbi:MAG: hypothetical protein ACE5R6_09960 [Candidatus Heimdallarchaeota archaeon]
MPIGFDEEVYSLCVETLKPNSDLAYMKQLERTNHDLERFLVLPINRESPMEGFQDYSYPPVIITDPQTLGYVGTR